MTQGPLGPGPCVGVALQHGLGVPWDNGHAGVTVGQACLLNQAKDTFLIARTKEPGLDSCWIGPIGNALRRPVSQVKAQVNPREHKCPTRLGR